MKININLRVALNQLVSLSNLLLDILMMVSTSFLVVNLLDWQLFSL